MACRNAGLLFFVDIERQQLLCVEPVRETDTRRVRRHVHRVMAMFDAGQLRTDESSVYDHIVAEPVRQVCIAHWLKSKCKRAWDLARQFRAEGMLYEAKTMRGFKKWDKVLAHSYLAQFIRGTDGVCDLSKLV